MKVYSLGNSGNRQQWDLGTALGKGFEDAIYDLLCIALKPYYSLGVKVYQTPFSGDMGKDIIISTPVSLTIFNQQFHMNGKKDIQIYIECKSTAQDVLRFEKVIGNAEKIKESGANYFVLVTNASITPYSHYRICENLRSYGIGFIIVDQILLADYMASFGRLIGEYDFTKRPDQFYAEYQVDSNKVNGRNAYDLYIVCRNYTDKNYIGMLSLLTDRNWDSEENEYSFVIEPFGSFSRKVTVVRAYSDGIDDLLFKIKAGANEAQIHIQGKDAENVFEPPFVGKENHLCIQAFTRWIEEEEGFRLHYLWGDSGVGKSRVLKEVYKTLDGRSFDFGFFNLGKDNEKTKKSIRNFLIEKKYLHTEKSNSSLEETVSCTAHEYRRAVLLIDDLHNSSDIFIKELRSMIKSELQTPVTIILCGRTDYSVYNPPYFSFVKWCNENHGLEGRELCALEPGETEQLVRVMINQVPNIVLRKICDLSNNTPLFIVQFIEYLLEASLVSIVNRNTVGISNISTFSSKVYIPDKVEDIYSKRLDCLLQLPRANELLDFLIVITELDGHLSAEQCLQILNEDKAVIDILANKRILHLDNRGYYDFVHETLYLFFKNHLQQKKQLQTRAAQLILSSCDNILSSLSRYQKGKLLYWDKQIENAKVCFASSVHELEAVENLSNLDIDTILYDYLYIIYSLYQTEKSKKELLKRIITTRIYIALHHMSPAMAIKECDGALIRLQKNKGLSHDKLLRYAILAQKAHALMLAGQFADGERLLNDLLSSLLIEPDAFELGTKFDLYDRLCVVHLKNNRPITAENYNKLSLVTAAQSSDNSLTIIAHRTRSKLYFYHDPQKAWDSLSHVDHLTADGSFNRIHICNRAAMQAYSMVYEADCDLENIYNEASLLLTQSLQNGFGFAATRCYLNLAACSFLLDSRETGYRRAKDFLFKGIDTSIRFSIASNIWQFYNLLGIVDLNLDYELDHVKRVFSTAYTILTKQNLLSGGSLVMCYGNLQAISNYGFFLQANGLETEFYRSMSFVTYEGNQKICDYHCEKPSCGYFCPNNTKKLRKEYINAQKKCLLFAKQTPEKLLRDRGSQYFIVLS